LPTFNGSDRKRAARTARHFSYHPAHHRLRPAHLGGGGSYEHHYPATGDVQAVVPLAGVSDVDAAVGAARSAFPGWRDLDLNRRRDILLAIARALLAEEQALAAIATQEMGMPNHLAGHAAHIAADWFSY
jgi:aldehyde dehydrogenase (NAD+)